jgi:hypothetical protein
VQNRKIAREIMALKLDKALNKQESYLELKLKKKRKKIQKKKYKARKKYGSGVLEGETGQDGSSEDFSSTEEEKGESESGGEINKEALLMFDVGVRDIHKRDKDK